MAMTMSEAAPKNYGKKSDVQILRALTCGNSIRLLRFGSLQMPLFNQPKISGDYFAYRNETQKKKHQQQRRNGGRKTERRKETRTHNCSFHSASRVRIAHNTHALFTRNCAFPFCKSQNGKAADVGIIASGQK